jgi:hypothetical protein
MSASPAREDFVLAALILAATVAKLNLAGATWGCCRSAERSPGRSRCLILSQSVTCSTIQPVTHSDDTFHCDIHDPPCDYQPV